MTKARASRIVTADDRSLSNREIKEEVQRRFGLDVGSNHINELIGPYRERRNQGESGRTLAVEAKKYLNTVGGIRMAVQLLHSVAAVM
jgi:hypothetical protein